MKVLSLIRHAKSSWKFEGLADVDRPLNNRGRGDAAVMGRFLAQSGFAPERWICSNAVRAIRTAEVIAEAVNFPTAGIEIEKAFYHNTIDGMLTLLRATAEHVRWVAAVGHNPLLTDLANYLGTDPIENVPTCGVVELHFGMDRWDALGREAPLMVKYEVPRDHR